MENQKSKAGRYLSELDRISYLPWPVLDNILGRLSMIDAVRTVVLSRRWRGRWTKVSKLVFDDGCKVESGQNHDVVPPLSKFIYHVLLSHHGQIDSFSVCTSSLVLFRDFDTWLYHLTRSGVNKITFKHSSDPIKIPRCLYSCQQLTQLDMCNVHLEIDYFNMSNGFPNLVSLELSNFFTRYGSVYKDDLVIIIRKCPVLERLVLKDFSVDDHLRFEASKLKFLCLVGEFRHVILEHCPLLEDVTLVGTRDHYFYDKKETDFSFVHELSRLSSLKKFKTSGTYLQYIYKTETTDPLPTASIHFKVLELDKISTRSLGQTTGSLTMLKLFSNLKELNITIKIDSYSEEAHGLMRKLNESSFCFDTLQYVTIHIIPSNSKHEDMFLDFFHPDFEYVKFLPEFDFLGFLLGHSPALEKMVIVCDEHVQIRDTIYETTVVI